MKIEKALVRLSALGLFIFISGVFGMLVSASPLQNIELGNAFFYVSITGMLLAILPIPLVFALLEMK